MSVASAAVAMSGFMIVFPSYLIAFLRRREIAGSGFCANRRCRVLLRAVAVGLIGVVLLALDFAGG
jgi:hypothetical protein